jgi:hypothetical protein
MRLRMLRFLEASASQDPLEAAKFALSRAVSALWDTVLAEHGFARFAERAAPQLIRWESAYGWRYATGAWKVPEWEIALADVLAPMLTTPDMSTGFADEYLARLDRIAAADGPPGGQGHELPRSRREAERADADFARWNEVLSGHINEERAERLAHHPAFEGPDADFLRARAVQRRGDIDAARTLIWTCLERLPGSQQFAELAEEVGAALPPGPGRCEPNVWRSRPSSRRRIRAGAFPQTDPAAALAAARSKCTGS